MAQDAGGGQGEKVETEKKKQLPLFLLGETGPFKELGTRRPRAQ